MVATDKKETKLNEASFTSYKDNAKDHCWYDSCDCDDVMVADCNALVYYRLR